MDVRQVEEQLALRLASAVFGDAPAGAILTSVTITRQDLGALIAQWTSTAAKVCPFAVLRVSSVRSDPEGASHASGSMGKGVRQTMRVQVAIVAGSINDPIPSPQPSTSVGNVSGDDVHGQGAVIGKAVVIGTQAGQGVDRIVAEIVRQALGNGVLVDNVHGVAGRIVSEADLQPVFGVQLLGRRLELEITNGSSVESYHAPTRVLPSSVGTTITVAWSAVPARPDFVGYVLKRNNVQVYAGTNTSFSDATGASGTYNYALTAVYDDAGRPPSSSNRSSPPVTLTVTV